MMMPTATGHNRNKTACGLMSRAGAKNSTAGETKKWIEIMSYGNNKSDSSQKTENQSNRE